MTRETFNDSRNISSASADNKGRGGGRGFNRGSKGGRGRGRRRNIYLGSYSPEQWCKLSKEDKQKVYDGRQKSAAEQQKNQQSQSHGGRSAGGRGMASVVMQQQPDYDNQSQLTGFVTNTNANANISNLQSHANNMESSILQGALNGSAAIGEKRPNTNSAGSFM
jgi:hypothetical protein